MRSKKKTSYVGIFRAEIVGQKKGGGSYHRGAPYQSELRVVDVAVVAADVFVDIIVVVTVVDVAETR